MITQEDIYTYIFNEDWKEILNVLYNEKDKINTDAMLGHASRIFEEVFFKKVEFHDVGDDEITNHLDRLYLLHHGKFYVLTDENYKKLSLELAKRKPLNEAYSYAKDFPENEFCKGIISEYKIQKQGAEQKANNKIAFINMNLIEIYNRLFELINNQSDTATYFSGPRFIDTVRTFSPYFPTYSQFIEQRNNEGKSTSRKIFYYDILLSLDEDIRMKVIKRVLEIVKPFEEAKTIQIENLINNKPELNVVKEVTIKQENNNDSPTVFISYSWDDEAHKLWVLDLSERLVKDGVNVILDRYYLTPGTNLQYFVENNLDKVDRIIVVFTPNYKLKADKRTGGVGYEYSIMNIELYKNISRNKRIIPLLRKGEMEDSIPTFMQQFIHIDVRNDENFENSYNDLIREIYNEPEIVKPEIGLKPTFR
ncbi:toll/interleukin-1 receptor domain-containing protein [Myroides sp. N17-2]|uniref:toll/interleukin-1 receptor domain-containing protein n=1 Tax=Myroides sp. N17-2 TaxID=2030799 RepID=UPI000EFD8EAC|nr:toll/interleukin-1 receptor domain-containing protein [Myroides sp. N17-2]